LDCLRTPTCVPFTRSASPSCPRTWCLLSKQPPLNIYTWWLMHHSCWLTLSWQTYPRWISWMLCLRWTFLIKGVMKEHNNWVK
jgi:hypothetical protein